MTAEQAKKFLECRCEYEDYSADKISLEVKEWSSGPIIALCLSRENAIELWRNLVGGDDCSVAMETCDDNDVKDMKNVVHGSKCESDAQRELHFFFPTSKQARSKHTMEGM